MFAAQFCFMKDCGNTSSISFAVVRPYKRHYHSDLSIWLSVDPMSDKYPGVSPYTYCANNPVRLVDPNGEEWGNGYEKIANQVISAAQRRIEHNERRISRLSKNEKSLQRNEMAIAEYQDQNCLLQEGIDGLKKMGETPEYTFRLDKVEKGPDLFSYKTSYESTDIFIMYDSYFSTAWHECVHIQDWLNNSLVDPEGLMTHDFKKKGELFVLGCNSGHNGNGASNERFNEFCQDIELHAYLSEYAFSLALHSPSRFFAGENPINSLESVEKNISKLMGSKNM